MPTAIEVPNMGESITEGVIAQWLVSDGDYVNEGDPLFELETDKISTEVPAPASGTVHIDAKDGDSVAIGSSVGSLDTEASKPDQDELPEPAGTTDPERLQASDDAEDNTAEKPAPEPATISTPEDRGVATPAARALMQEHRISPDAITGTGAKGHITKGDVLAFIEQKPAAQGPDRPATAKQPSAPAPAPTAQPAAEATVRSDATINAGERRERMSPLRQRIATRLVQAQHTAAILTTFNEIDMAPCMAMRKRFKERFAEKHEVNLGFMSFFGKAVCEALADFPLINARIEGSEVVHPEHVNLGIAVGTDKGLVVPVLRAAEELSFAEVERGIKEFAGRARSGKLTIPDMEGGTFTITNGGVYGSLLSTPIINPPQSGILGMHTIKERPIALNGEVVIRPMMYVALSYDHRIVDGAGAVGFLVRIKQLIEEPERLLFDL